MQRHILITACWEGVFPWESWTLYIFSRIQSRSLVSSFSHRPDPAAYQGKDWTACPEIMSLNLIFHGNKTHGKSQSCGFCNVTFKKNPHNRYLSQILFDLLTFWLSVNTHTHTWMHIHSARVSHDKTGKGHSPVYHPNIDYLLQFVPLCVCVQVCLCVCVCPPQQSAVIFKKLPVFFFLSVFPLIFYFHSYKRSNELSVGGSAPSLKKTPNTFQPDCPGFDYFTLYQMQCV